MSKFAVTYSLSHIHEVTVGIEAEDEAAAIRTAESLFDAGDIWDDTPAVPLLHDDFEEAPCALLEFKAEPVSEFTRDSTVEVLRLHSASRDLLHALEALIVWADYLGGFQAPQWKQASAAIAKAKGDH
jgi:hypothetical protein